MSSRRLSSATCPVLPATDPIGPTTRPSQPELAATQPFVPLAGPSRLLSSSPRLYRALRCDPRDQATRILLETERLLRSYGHRKLRVAEIADACGFSAANVYRYFSSRGAILDALASHYLREAERTALACAIRNRRSARDRLSAFLFGLNTALVIFADSEPKVIELLADAAGEQWPCYSRHDARVVRRIAMILAAASASGEFRLEADAAQEARHVKAAACALLEPDVIRLRRNSYDVATREALSRLLAAALLNRSVSPSRASRHAD
jgi:AcrR family transcriptional regulator